MHRLTALCIALLIALGAATFAPLQAQPRPAPPNPRAALAQLSRERGEVETAIDPVSGTPGYVRGRLADNARRNPQAAAQQFFVRYGAAWGLDQADQQLELKEQTQDTLGYIGLRYTQRAQGLPVFDTDLRVQIDPGGVLTTITGRLFPSAQPTALQPRIDQAAAIQHARRIVGDTRAGLQVQTAPRLGIVRKSAVDRLAWEVWLFDPNQPARWQIRLDARDGTLISHINVLGAARERYTYSAINEDVARREPDGPTSDAQVNAAHDNAGKTYDWYWNTFRRDSFDNRGARIISSVYDGVNNAFWDGSQMRFGAGDGIKFGSLPSALDIVAHEYTHGVTEYSANLNYAYESGALNEAFSDVFAMLIDDRNWEIGEDAYTPGSAGDALRSAADPTRIGDASVWGEYLRTELDNGGIHSNSGIWNHLAYEIGTTIGRPKTAQIFYRALTQKLTATTDFAVARLLTLQACEELIGTQAIASRDCEDVRMAFIRSGIGQSSLITAPGSFAQRRYFPLIVAGAPNDPPRLPPLTPPACTTELVRNNSFEQGLTGWVTDAPPTTVATGYPTRTGSRSAQLNALYQLLHFVQLPVGARTVTIQFNILRTTVVDANQQTLEVRAEAGDGTALATLATLTGAQPANEWRAFTATLNVEQLRDLRLIFADRYGTHYIDDVSIVATCGG